MLESKNYEIRKKRTLQDDLETIDKLFSRPNNISLDDLNLVFAVQDEKKIGEYKLAIEKCHEKRDLIKKDLENAANFDERDKIMCAVTIDPDLGY